MHPDYIRKRVVAWSPTDDVDMVVICVDADDRHEERAARLQQSLEIARRYHFNGQSEQVPEASVGGLAIKTIETWLIADNDAVHSLLNVPLPLDLPEDLETLPGAKRDIRTSRNVLDAAIRQSHYRREINRRERKLTARWQLAALVDMDRVKSRCQRGYGQFAADLTKGAHVIEQAHEI